MIPHALAGHFARLLLHVGPGFVAWAVAGRIFRIPEPEPRTLPALSRATTTASLLLMVFGWLAFPWLLREPMTLQEVDSRERARREAPAATGEGSNAELRLPACLLMVGLAAAGVSARLGLSLEGKRLKKTGSGTDVASMMKRATFFFFALSAGAAAAAGSRAQAGRGLGWWVAGGLSGLWLPAAVAWRARPRAGPVGPAASLAWRATFFALAVLGLSSAALPSLLGEGTSRALRLSLTALWMGIGLGAVTLVAVTWLASRTTARGSILWTGLLATLGGLCLGAAV